MTPEFKVGDLAVYIGTVAKHYGTTCTVTGPLAHRRGLTARGRILYALSYLTDLHGETGLVLAVHPQHLRKPPPKQDWVKLCQLNEHKYVFPKGRLVFNPIKKC